MFKFSSVYVQVHIFPPAQSGTQRQNPECSTDNWPAHNMTSVSDEIVSKWDICWTEHLWPHVENQDTEKLLYSALHYISVYITISTIIMERRGEKKSQHPQNNLNSGWLHYR